MYMSVRVNKKNKNDLKILFKFTKITKIPQNHEKLIVPEHITARVEQSNESK